MDARRFLRPLLLAGAAGRTQLTRSGVHYLALGMPGGPQGATSVALHVADGSEIVSRRVGGPSLSIWVGKQGRERFGSCLARLATPTLADGWLPILQTRYVDAGGVRYRQESFVARVGRDRSLVSFLRLAVDARGARAGADVRLVASRGAATVRRVPSDTTRTFFAGWHVSRGRTLAIDEDAYASARASVVRYWENRLDDGMAIDVPERRVVDALRALRVQSLTLTWRYSSGNQYEQFSFPEGVDVAQVLGEQGFEDVARSILRTSLTRPSTRYPNWKMGERLLALGDALRPVPRPRLPPSGDAGAARLRHGARPADRQLESRASRPGALLVGHPRRGLRPALPDRRLGRAARDGGRVGPDGPEAPRSDGAAPRRSARNRPPASSPGIRAAARGRVALHPRSAPRRRAPVRLADRGARGQLLEPRHAVRARLGLLRAGEPRGPRRAPLPRAARLAAARARPGRRLFALRARGALPGVGDRPGLRDQRRAASSPTRARQTSSCSASTASSRRR